MTEASKEELHEFERLIDEGRFYETLEWIDAGSPV